MGKILFCFILALALLFLAPVSDAKIKKSHKKFADATFALWGELNGAKHFICTATAIEKITGGYKLLTAGHCVAELPDGVKLEVTEDIAVNSVFYPVAVIKFKYNESLDFAFLDLKTIRKYPTIPLIYGYKPEIDTKVENVNFSEGIGKIISDGPISTPVLLTHGADNDCSPCYNHFMVQIFAGRGASGSAVVDAKLHKIIGIVTGGTEDTLGAFVEPVFKLPEFLAAP